MPSLLKILFAGFPSTYSKVAQQSPLAVPVQQHHLLPGGALLSPGAGKGDRNTRGGRGSKPLLDTWGDSPGRGDGEVGRRIRDKGDLDDKGLQLVWWFIRD